MEPNSIPAVPAASAVCSVCHQPVFPTYYFCPNCGNKLHAPPLSTSLLTQVGLYAFSVVLPMICFIMISKWRGIQYIKSADQKARKIGMVALSLLIISTIVSTWLAIIWIQQSIQSSVNSLNAEMSAGY